MKWFRKENGELVNAIDYTLEVIQRNPNVRIYIGTDSQSSKKFTRFVTCICYRYENGKGAHYIFHKEKQKKVKDIFMRLYNEGTMTMEVFSEFEEVPIKIEALEFDYNSIKQTISTKLIGDFRGWCEALNQKALFKGDEMVACKAADHICRN